MDELKEKRKNRFMFGFMAVLVILSLAMWCINYFFVAKPVKDAFSPLVEVVDSVNVKLSSPEVQYAPEVNDSLDSLIMEDYYYSVE